MAPRKKTGKEKGLAFPPSPHGFPALPLDILYEVRLSFSEFRRETKKTKLNGKRQIFSLLHPLQLLYLTRTTKPFRRFLLNRANVGIWRAAFSVLRADGLPACPPYASEPAWARLVFEKVCNVVCFRFLLSILA
jgi:hypothetical protein